MTDPRYTRLAETLIHYSCELQPGEKVLIEAIDIPHAFTNELIRVAHQADVRPNVLLKSNQVVRSLLMGATEDQLEVMARGEETVMDLMDAYIGVRGAGNISELSDVPGDQMKLYEKMIWKRVHTDIRVARTRWVVLRWPSPSMAQLAETSTEAFDDFYFDVCTMDYGRMAEAMKPLQSLMEATDRVRLLAPDTDLSFSINGIPAMPCDGKRNIPDGEVYTAPGARQRQRHDPLQHTHRVPGREPRRRVLPVREREDRRGDEHQYGTPEPRARLRRGRPLHRRVRDRLQSLHHRADEGHPVRREDRRAHSTSRRATPTRWRTTATAARSTGTSC